MSEEERLLLSLKRLLALCLIAILAGAAFILIRGRLRGRDLIHPTVLVSVYSTVQLHNDEGESCVSLQELRIHRQERIGRGDGDEIHAPLCYHLVGWSGSVAECLIEYPISKPGGLQPTSFVARAAVMYYQVSQGGVAFFAADDSSNAYIMLDPRWCNNLGVASGLNVVAE